VDVSIEKKDQSKAEDHGYKIQNFCHMLTIGMFQTIMLGIIILNCQ